MTDEYLEKHRREILDTCGQVIQTLDGEDKFEARERTRQIASRLKGFEDDSGVVMKIEHAGFIRGLWSERSQGEPDIEPVWDVTVSAAVVGCMAEYSMELMADMIGMEVEVSVNDDSGEIVLRG